MCPQEKYNNYNIENLITEREIQLLIYFSGYIDNSSINWTASKVHHYIIVFSEKASVLNAERENEPLARNSRHANCACAKVATQGLMINA